MSETDVDAGEETDHEGDAPLPETLTHATWAAALRDGRLLGQSCRECGHVAGAPKAACAHCGSRDLATVRLPTTGEVYTETTVNVPPEGFEEESYQVGMVTVGDARVMARFESAVAIGDGVALSGYVTGEDDAPVPAFE